MLKGLLEPDNLIIKRKGIIIRFIDNRAVLLNPEHRYPFRLNQMGTRIWELLESHQKIADLVDTVADLYDADRKEVAHDIKDFLSELMDKKLIETG